MTRSRARHGGTAPGTCSPVWSLPDRSLVPTQPARSPQAGTKGASLRHQAHRATNRVSQASVARVVRCWDPETQPGSGHSPPQPARGSRSERGLGCPRTLRKGMVVSGPQPQAGMVRAQTQTHPCTQHGPGRGSSYSMVHPPASNPTPSSGSRLLQHRLLWGK